MGASLSSGVSGTVIEEELLGERLESVPMRGIGRERMREVNPLERIAVHTIEHAQSSKVRHCLPLQHPSIKNERGARGESARRATNSTSRGCCGDGTPLHRGSAVPRSRFYRVETDALRPPQRGCNELVTSGPGGREQVEWRGTGTGHEAVPHRGREGNASRRRPSSARAASGCCTAESSSARSTRRRGVRDGRRALHAACGGRGGCGQS